MTSPRLAPQSSRSPAWARACGSSCPRLRQRNGHTASHGCQTFRQARLVVSAGCGSSSFSIHCQARTTKAILRVQLGTVHCLALCSMASPKQTLEDRQPPQKKAAKYSLDQLPPEAAHNNKNNNNYMQARVGASPSCAVCIPSRMLRESRAEVVRWAQSV